jgi:hypothetical protein
MTQEFIPIYDNITETFFMFDGDLEVWIEEHKDENDGEMPNLSQLVKCLPTKVPLINTDFEDVFMEDMEIPKALLDAAEAYNAIARVTETHTFYPTKIKYVYD